MTMQTPATPSQPRDDRVPADPAPRASGDGPPARTSRLGRAAWWCLAAFPPVFVVVMAVGLVVFPDGPWASGSVGESVLLAVLYVALAAAPLAALVLSSLAFRRTRSWRDLAPALALLAIVAAFFAVAPAMSASPNPSRWEYLVPPLGIAAWIAAVLVWPRRKG